VKNYKDFIKLDQRTRTPSDFFFFNCNINPQIPYATYTTYIEGHGRGRESERVRVRGRERERERERDGRKLLAEERRKHAILQLNEGNT